MYGCNVCICICVERVVEAIVVIQFVVVVVMPPALARC